MAGSQHICCTLLQTADADVKRRQAYIYPVLTVCVLLTDFAGSHAHFGALAVMALC
jgi:hypothetical protein